MSVFGTIVLVVSVFTIRVSSTCVLLVATSDGAATLYAVSGYLRVVVELLVNRLK